MPDGKVYLVEGNIKQGEAWGVLLHKFGVHVRRVLGDTSVFQNILRSIERREGEQSATGKAIREAI